MRGRPRKKEADKKIRIVFFASPKQLKAFWYINQIGIKPYIKEMLEYAEKILKERQEMTEEEKERLVRIARTRWVDD